MAAPSTTALPHWLFQTIPQFVHEYARKQGHLTAAGDGITSQHKYNKLSIMILPWSKDDPATQSDSSLNHGLITLGNSTNEHDLPRESFDLTAAHDMSTKHAWYGKSIHDIVLQMLKEPITADKIQDLQVLDVLCKEPLLCDQSVVEKKVTKHQINIGISVSASFQLGGQPLMIARPGGVFTQLKDPEFNDKKRWEEHRLAQTPIPVPQKWVGFDLLERRKKLERDRTIEQLDEDEFTASQLILDIITSMLKVRELKGEPIAECGHVLVNQWQREKGLTMILSPSIATREMMDADKVIHGDEFMVILFWQRKQGFASGGSFVKIYHLDDAMEKDGRFKVASWEWVNDKTKYTKILESDIEDDYADDTDDEALDSAEEDA